MHSLSERIPHASPARTPLENENEAMLLAARRIIAASRTEYARRDAADAVPPRDQPAATARPWIP